VGIVKAITLTTAQRKSAYQKIGRTISRFVVDPQVGICNAHPWGVRKSAGFDVLQIITEQRPSKLEQRSEQTHVEE